MGLDIVELELAIEDEFRVSAFAGGGFRETVWSTARGHL